MPYVATGHISAGIIVVCGFLDYETTILRLRGRCCGSNYVAIPVKEQRIMKEYDIFQLLVRDQIICSNINVFNIIRL